MYDSCNFSLFVSPSCYRPICKCGYFICIRSGDLSSLKSFLELRNLTQDGGFSPWAPWQPCNHDDGEGSISSCLCRSRSCDGPVAQCGGAECRGPTIQVANCSRYIVPYFSANCQLHVSPLLIPFSSSSSGTEGGLLGLHGASAAAVAASGLR